MKFFVSKKVVVGFCVAMIILTLLGIYSFWNNRASLAASQGVTHTMDVLYNMEKLRSSIISLESSQRGFVVTRNKQFIFFNQQEAAEATARIKDVQKLTRDNVTQQQNLDSLISLIERKIAFNRQTVKVAETNSDSAYKRIESLEGENLKRKILGVLNRMEMHERSLMEERTYQTRAELIRFNFSFSMLILFALCLLTAVFIAVNNTIGARIHAQAMLEKTTEELNDLYNNSPCGYFSVDAAGTFIHMNETLLRTLGYARQEVIQRKKIPEIVVIEDEPHYQKSFSEFKEVGQISDIEISLRCKSGEIIPFHLNSIAMFNENNQFVMARSSLFDISERKKAEEKARASAKELESFTYSVSHDLRAPLRSISGFVKILEEDYGHTIDQEGKRLIKIIERNASQMGNLIDDLLDFSRMNRKEISEQEIDLDDMVKQIMTDMIQQEKDRSINFKIEPLGTIRGDLSMLRQVWVNLISNSIKYTRKKPVAEIEIASKLEGDKKIFSIRDNGVGFDMKYHHKLFGVFQRLHKAQDFEGTGVGLALVHRIISRHGGDIWAEAAPDQGATFLFFLTNDRT
jgi:PAS domain S-box-containing protein